MFGEVIILEQIIEYKAKLQSYFYHPLWFVC